MTKRIICLVLALAMIFGLTACKKNSSGDSEYSYWEEVVIDGENTNTSSDNNSSVVSENGNKNTSTTTPSNSDPDDPDDPTPEVPDFKGASITIMREWDPYPNGKNAAWDNFNAWVNKCEKKFNVKIVEKKWKATLAGEMLAGVKPEGHYYLVGATGGGNIYDMATKGYLAYFDDAMKETGIDMTADHYNEFNTGVGNLNGKQWTIGFGFARIASAVLYNKKMLADAGQERTLTTDTSVQGLIDANKWTWDKMTEIAKKVTKRNASGEVTVWGIGIGTSGIRGLVLSNGGHIIHPDSKGKFQSYLNSENTKEALQQAYDWLNVDKVANTFSGGQWQDMGRNFADKKVAMIFGGHHETGAAYSGLTGDDYGVAYLPMGPKMKKYVSYMTYEYCYVVPASYQDMTPELLILADELHDWPVEGYTRDDEFRDEWTRYFHTAEQYNMWYNMHFSDKVERMWDGSSVVGFEGGTDMSEMTSGRVTPAVWVDTNHQAYTKAAADVANKYTYTGKLK